MTSFKDVTVRPAACSARRAASRPEPGPFTYTATFRTPCSIAFSAASLPANWAAKGVLLRDPLKPATPALDQAMVVPLTSVIVTTVLLNVLLMWAIPSRMFFLTLLARRALDLLALLAPSLVLVAGSVTAAEDLSECAH